jgi:hypothetical protein
MPITYDTIATTTLAAATSNVSFSNISQSYTDLKIVASIIGTGGNVQCRFNGDSGTNYCGILFGNSGGTVLYGSQQTNDWLMYAGGFNNNMTTGVANQLITDIFSYTQSNFKGIINQWYSEKGSAGGIDMSGWLWKNNAAISSIAFFTGNTFSIGTTFSIYGILKA